jgi:hypothetical protein
MELAGAELASGYVRAVCASWQHSTSGYQLLYLHIFLIESIFLWSI